MDLLKTITSGRIPYDYIVGGKDTGKSSGVPIDVKLSVDKDFAKVLVKSVSIIAVGIGLGVVAGMAITKKRS